MLLKNIVIFSVIILIFSCGAPEVKDQYWQDFLVEIEQEIKNQGLGSPTALSNCTAEDPGLGHIELDHQLVWSWTKDHPNDDIHKCRIKLVRYSDPDFRFHVVWVIIPQVDYYYQRELKTETILTFYYKLNHLDAQAEARSFLMGLPKKPSPKEQVSLSIIWYAMKYLHSHPKV